MSEALRLADALESRNGNASGFGLGPVCDEAAALLRQQAAEIERLRADAERMKRAITGLLLTDPGGRRKDWPEHIEARAAIDQARQA